MWVTASAYLVIDSRFCAQRRQRLWSRICRSHKLQVSTSLGWCKGKWNRHTHTHTHVTQHTHTHTSWLETSVLFAGWIQWRLSKYPVWGAVRLQFSGWTTEGSTTSADRTDSRKDFFFCTFLLRSHLTPVLISTSCFLLLCSSNFVELSLNTSAPLFLRVSFPSSIYHPPLLCTLESGIRRKTFPIWHEESAQK